MTSSPVVGLELFKIRKAQMLDQESLAELREIG